MGFPVGASGKRTHLPELKTQRCGWGRAPWRRAWQPTPVFLPGESHGQRSLVGYSSSGHKDLDMTEVT